MMIIIRQCFQSPVRRRIMVSNILKNGPPQTFKSHLWVFIICKKILFV